MRSVKVAIRALVVLALSAGACDAPPLVTLTGGWWDGAPLHGDVYHQGYKLDPSLSQWTELVQAGANAWRSFGVILEQDEHAKLTVSCEQPGQIKGGVGWTNVDGTIVDCAWLAALDLPDSWRIEMFAHEFGHEINLGHSADPQAVMFRDLNGNNVFNEGDVENYEYTRGRVQW